MRFPHRFPVPGRLQAAPAEQKVRVPAEGPRPHRSVRGARRMDASGQTEHAGVQHRHRRRLVPDQTGARLHKPDRRHNDAAVSVGARQRAADVQGRRRSQRRSAQRR